MATKVRAVAFDFDGVIADTTQLKSDLFLKMFEGLPEYSQVVAYEKEYQSLPRRRKFEDVLGTILKKNINENLDFYLKKYAEDLDVFLPKAPLIKGFETFFLFLQKNKILPFVVSSGQKLEIEKYLGPLRTSAFTQIFDATTPKPFALKQIMNQYALKNSELLFLGDNSSDYKAAQKALCQFVAINPNAEFPPDIKSFPDFSVFDLQLLL